jgi:hypothetical protein
MRKVALAVLLALAYTSPLHAGAPDAPITVAEVSTQRAAGAEIDAREFRALVDEAVGALDKSKLPRKEAVALSVSLVKMESKVSSGAEVRCTVSATLRDRKRGAIFAMLEGSARGEDAPPRRRALERATLKAALASAIARVPEAMRGAQ